MARFVCMSERVRGVLCEGIWVGYVTHVMPYLGPALSGITGGSAAWSRAANRSSGGYIFGGTNSGGGNSLAATGRPITSGTATTGVTSRTSR